MRRMISLLLAAALVLTLIPVLPGRAEAATGSKLVALTFDDGPSGRYTEQLLDGLKERNVPVTFFMLGEMADQNPDIVRRAYEEGHEIACHSWDHPDLTGLSNSKVQEQMDKTYAVLDEACGEGTEYLVRPPYGSTNQRVRNAIDAPLIYWSVDSRDWELLNTAKVRDRICADTYDGSIILCHDIHRTTIPAALQAIDILQEAGYEFVTVSELYRRRGREMEDHVLHYNSKRNGVDLGPIPAPQISIRHSGWGSFTVTITCQDENAPIYYTLDGSYPNQEATCYTGPFTVDYFTEVTAVAAYNLNGSRSELTVLDAGEYPCCAPVMSLDAEGRLVLQTETPGADIYYTLDDTYPTASDLRYTGPAYIPGDSDIRCVAIHDDAGVSTETGPWYYSAEGKLYADMSPDDWYYDAMEQVHLAGILNGTDAYTMSPGGTLTRGMLVTLLHRSSGESLGSGWAPTNAFADVDRSDYYAEAIEWAYRNGIVNGYSDAAFGPDDAVTREQMCKIVAGYLSHMDMPLLPGPDALAGFADQGIVAPWARDSVAALVKAGLIQGDGRNIDPTAKANRAQFCTLLCRVLEYEADYVPLVLTLEPETLTITEGEQTALEWDYNGDAADLRWSSGNPEVATVDSDGTVTAWTPGDARITVTDGLNTGICDIHVESAIPAVERIEFVSTDGPFETGMIGYQGDHVTLTVRTLPVDAEDGVVIASGRPDVVTVVGGEPDENGCSEFRLEFVGPGSTQVTVSSVDGAVTMVFDVEVRAGYDFAPGDKPVTPGQFAEYATRVLREAGFAAAKGGNWRLLRLSPEELTFDNAVGTAWNCIHTWWPEGIRNGKIIYVGQYSDGRYEFRLCWD